MLRHPAAPSKCFGTVSAVMTLARFHFHQARKIPRDERFKPELTIAGLKPKLPIVRQRRQLQGPGKQINLSYKRQGAIYLDRGMIASEHSSHTMSVRFWRLLQLLNVNISCVQNKLRHQSEVVLKNLQVSGCSLAVFLLSRLAGTGVQETRTGPF